MERAHYTASMRLVAFALVAACHHEPAPVRSNTTPAPPVASAKPGRVVVSDTQVEILPILRFDGQSTRIVIEAIPTLDALAATLKGNPEILLVEVRAFGSDNVAEFQQQIGELRAQTIVDELVKRGVEPKRLRAHGLAVSPNGDPRPVLEIVQRAP